MTQIVTNENMMELITTGSVPEFVPDKAADAKAPEVKVEPEAKAPEKKEEVKPDLRERNEDGTFKTEAEKSADDASDEALPEKVRKQIGKKHRQMKEAEEYARSKDAAYRTEKERADRAEAELRALRQNSEGHRAEDGKSGDPGKPDPEKFKTVGEYTAALVEYEVAKTAKAAQEKGEQLSAQQQAQAQIDATAKVFADRQAEYIKANPDYAEALEETEIQIPNAALNYIVESDMGPQLTHYLLRNEEEAERLSKLSPSRAIAELGKLEAKLEKKPTDKVVPIEPKVSKAPPPATSIVTAASVESTKDPKDMNYDEYRAYKDAQRRSQRRA